MWIHHASLILCFLRGTGWLPCFSYCGLCCWEHGCMSVCLWSCFPFFWCLPGSGIAGWHGNFVFKFLNHFQNSSQGQDEKEPERKAAPSTPSATFSLPISHSICDSTRSDPGRKVSTLLLKQSWWNKTFSTACNCIFKATPDIQAKITSFSGCICVFMFEDTHG
jgi:hypothetical protein